MRYVELENHIQSVLNGGEEFAPLYIVAGEDDYLKELVLKQFFGALDRDYADFNFSKLASDTSVDDLKDALDTYPMFDSVRVVAYEADEKTSEELRAFVEEYVKSPSPTSVLIVSVDGDANKVFKQKKATLVDCSRLEDEELVFEINKILAVEPSVPISRDACEELIRRTQGSMARIVSETNKLKAYATNTITVADIEEMVVPDIDYQIFELSNALAEKDGDKALEITNLFFANGVRGVTILNLVYDKYRKMLHAELNKDKTNDELGKMLGMKGGAVYYLRKTSSKYSQVRLKKCVDYLHSLQCDVLSGKRLEASALQEAVLQLLII
ncbi:MAG: DNA polymerase III subunit delta [Clostridia bacterium]|nr:DNA polymerase III subunit delta [Clostridia bacterium]